MPIKVIVFGYLGRVKTTSQILEEDANHEVKTVGVPSVDSVEPLLAAIRQHGDADAVIIYGGPIMANISYAMDQVRRLTQVPALLVVMRPSYGYGVQIRGATMVMERCSNITDREVVDEFAEMLWRVASVRTIMPSAGSAAVAEGRQENGARLAAEGRIGHDVDVLFYSRRFRLSDRAYRILALLHENKGEWVSLERFYQLGITRKKTPAAVAVAVSNLRKQLAVAEPSWATIIKGSRGSFILRDPDRR